MNIKELLNKVLYYISVPKCVLCKEKLDYSDRGLCKNCLKIYEDHKQRNCPRCSRILSKCFCSYDALEKKGVKNLVKIFRYSKSEQSLPSNYLIYSLKQDNREDVLSFLSDELADAIRNSIDLDEREYVITNVPRRKKAIILFGYDHAALLAKAVADKLGIKYVALLVSKSKKAQKSVFGDDRIENAKFEGKCNVEFNFKGKSVILVDDIITTGSSMINSASVLKSLGARRIIGACLGTAYKEKYIDFEYSAFE